MAIIDLRSDTVTLPTQAMREAIFHADLGDDVFGEDPTINRLEAMTAERLGMEAALLVVSGTMGNVTCVLTHCARGEEVILGDSSHIFLNEAGGMSALGGIFPHTIPNQPDGTLRLDEIEAAIRGDNIHFPRTRLICLENTHNRCYGAALTPEYTAAVAALAKSRQALLLHLDGARIFNAAVALGVDVRELTRGVDSRERLPLQGARRTGRLGDLREPRVYRAGAADPEDAGRRDAPGRDHRGRGDRRPEGDDRTASRRTMRTPAVLPRASPGSRVSSPNRPASRRTSSISISLISASRTRNSWRASRRRGSGSPTRRPARFRMLTHYGIGAAEIDAALAALRAVMQS